MNGSHGDATGAPQHFATPAWGQVRFNDFCDVSTMTLKGVTAGLNPNVDGVVRLTDTFVQSGSAFTSQAFSLATDVGIAVHSLTALRLEGAGPWLEGNMTPMGTSDATFQLTAVQAGRTSVQLEVSYGTEEQCTDAAGHFYCAVEAALRGCG